MPRGGARVGAGRPVGSSDGARLAQLKEATERAVIFLQSEGRGEFPGDSVDFLISIYKNQDLPIPLRVHCAVAAARYERPQLTAGILLKKDLTSPDFGKLLAELETRLALHPPEKRTQLIEALRNGEDEPVLPAKNGHIADTGD
jgi:hypothetical protein